MIILGTIYKLEDGNPIDLAPLNRQNQILFCRDRSEFRVIGGMVTAKLKKEVDEEMLSRARAVVKYPQYFFNSKEHVRFLNKMHSLCISINEQEYIFCKQKGPIVGYIRSLIDSEIKKEKNGRNGL